MYTFISTHWSSSQEEVLLCDSSKHFWTITKLVSNRVCFRKSMNQIKCAILKQINCSQRWQLAFTLNILYRYWFCDIILLYVDFLLVCNVYLTQMSSYLLKQGPVTLKMAVNIVFTNVINKTRKRWVEVDPTLILEHIPRLLLHNIWLTNTCNKKL